MQSSRLWSVCCRASLFLACGFAALAACSSDKRSREEAPPAERETAIGRMRLGLTARGASGALYRLRQATFQVSELSNGGFPIPVPPPGEIPPFEPLPDDEPPLIGTGGRPGSGGGIGEGGAAGVGSAGFAGSGGAAGVGGASTGGFGGSPDPGGLVTFLFSEADPLSTTLETNLRSSLYDITLFGGWFLEKVEFGQVTIVDAQLISSASQQFFISPNEETFVFYRFQTSNEVIDFGEGRLIVDIEVEEGVGPTPDDPRPGVMENNVDALAPFFTLEDALSAALRNAGSDQSALDVYHAIIDSYTTEDQGRAPDVAHCDDETTDGAPSLNGFPLMCPRQEANQFDNLDGWFPTAVSNRLDLAPVDGANCGQQRLIFANNQQNRMFIIVESEIPNPEPACGVSACRPLAEFWDNLSTIEDPFTRGELLQQAFITGGAPGLEAFGPFLDARHLGPDGGQIRTNNFDDFIWTLREFHFQEDLDAPPRPVPVAESPHGALWNDLSDLPQGEACRANFIEAASALFVDNPSAMSFPVNEECKDGESLNDFSEDYQTHSLDGSGEFLAELDERGAPFGLTGLDLAARARFAGSCIGCHMEAGGSFLGNGVFAPFQGDFVHVNELFTERCAGGECFGISEALRSVFLPHRRQVVTNLVNSPSCGSGPVEPGVDAGAPPIVIDPIPGGPITGPVGPGVESPRPTVSGEPLVRWTLGGQRATEHGH
ncbi:MAG: hypothetical protein ABW217_18615 [Polyangiaceae bacterium]